jgi:uncharacterized membrane protein
MLEAFLNLMRSHPWWWFCGLHATLGRAASVTFAVATGLSPWIYGPIAFGWDVAQVPLWWGLYTAVARHTLRLRLFSRWIEQREEKAEHRRVWRALGAMGDAGIVLLAALPFWGCGMWTSTLLAWTLGMRLRRAIWLLAAGGLLGLMLLMGLGELIKSLVT